MERRECDHCGAPVTLPDETGDDEPVFCCVGCRSVYEAIREWGFSGYYELQNRERAPSAPPGTNPDERELDRLDDPVFLEKQSESLEGGRRRAEFFLEGVHCSGCVWIVEQMPDHLDGVYQARLNLGRSRLTLVWEPDAIALSEIAEWLSQFGYGLHPLRRDGGGQRDVERRLLRRSGVTWALASNVMLLSIAMYAGLDGTAYPGLFHAFRAASCLLATAAVVYGGALFFRRAFASVRAFASREWRDWQLDQLSIDLPIAIGIVGGYGQSLYATVTGHGEVWFDSISILIAALLTARWLQVRSRRVAGDAAERLRSVLPWSARRVIGLDDGSAPESVETVELDAVEEGDVVEVRRGEVVPADGRLLASDHGGRARLQRAVLTGESRPEGVEPGETVHAGVRNVGGRIRLRVTQAAGESRIGRLMAWIDERGEEAPVVEWTDRIAGAFVLGVLVGAAATWLGWTWAGSSYAMQHTVALLVVACPCALGIATPLALTTAVGRGAGRGIFVKRDTAFQQLEDVDVVVFDKTGTVTRGQMAVDSSVYAPPFDQESDRQRLWAEIAAVEEPHAHPIADAFWREGRRRRTGADQVDATSTRSVTGQGVVGVVGGHRLRLGRPAWLSGEESAVVPDWFGEALTEILDEGQTPVAVQRDGELVALFGVGDPVRSEAHRVVESLQKEGIDVFLVSGDHPAVVERVGEQLGIPASNRAGDVSPETKREQVDSLAQSEGGKTVAMVGDGVNDAAALKTASVGIAVGESAQASLDAADIFANRGGIEPVLECISGGREVMRVIRRNLGMSILYNTVGISFAAAGWVTPLVAAVAMPVSSLAVVVSSVLQSSFDDRTDEKRPRPGITTEAALNRCSSQSIDVSNVLSR